MCKLVSVLGIPGAITLTLPCQWNSIVLLDCYPANVRGCWLPDVVIHCYTIILLFVYLPSYGRMCSNPGGYMLARVIDKISTFRIDTVNCDWDMDILVNVWVFFVFCFLPTTYSEGEHPIRLYVHFSCRFDNNNIHLSCAHQRPERSHDTY